MTQDHPHISATDLLYNQIADAEARMSAAYSNPLVGAYFARRKAAARESTDLLGVIPETPYITIDEAVAVTKLLAASSELYRLHNTCL